MKLYIFIYNVIAIKANLSELPYEENSQFVLIASDYCLKKLSHQNKAFFTQIHRIERDFHQVNINQIENIIIDYIKLHTSQNILLLTNEDSTQIVCAQLREKYDIPGNKIEQVLPYINKDISKQKLKGKVKVPQFILFNKYRYYSNSTIYQHELIEQIGFPMFIKPIDLVSSIGTFYVPNEKVLSSVLSSISQSSWQFEIDEFINGDIYHCDLIIVNDDIKFFMAGKYANPLAGFSKGMPMGSIPVRDKNLLANMKIFSQSVIEHLGAFSSGFHIQLFQERGSGELIFLEAAARTPGALVPEMYEIIFNVHLEKLHYLAKIGGEIQSLQLSAFQAGWVTYPQIEGQIIDIEFPKINIKHSLVNSINKGEYLKPAQSLLDSACSIIFWDESYDQVENIFRQLKTYQPLIIKTEKI